MNYSTLYSDTKPEDKDGIKSYTKWSGRISASQKLQAAWLKQAENIYKIYTGKESETDGHSSCVKHNIVWETHQLTKEAYYARPPITVAQVRQGFESPITKTAQSILKRDLDFFVSNADSSFNYNMGACRDDFRLIGRGVAWVVYKPENGSQEVVNDEGEEVEEDFLITEGVEIDYVNYKDFLQSKARRWDEVRWVAKRTYHTKEEIASLFGQEKADAFTKKDKQDEELDCVDIEVWEIWDKDAKKVIFWADRYKDGLLEEKDPPIQFKNFFPCPRPLLGTTSPDSMVPKADAKILDFYVSEINAITERIANITSAIRVFGAYDSSVIGMSDFFKSSDNYLAPVQNWKQFLEKGKFDGVMSNFPISDYITALQQLTQEKSRLEQEYYRASGSTSLMRGEAMINESAQSVQARSRFADLRLSSEQKEIQRFCRDCIALMADVICQNFEDSTILEIANVSSIIDETVTEEVVAQAIELLRNKTATSIAIEIETDSTIAINGEAERTDRLEFLNASINALNTCISVAENLPEFAEPAMKTLLFVLDAYPAAQPVDVSYKQSIEMFKKRKEAEAGQPPPLTIEEKELQMKQQIAQGEQQILLQKYSAEAGQAMQDAQMKFQIKQQELQFDYQKLQAENLAAIQKLQAEMQLQYQKVQGELMLLREKAILEAQVKREDIQVKGQLKGQEAAFDANLKRETAIADLQTKREAKQVDIQLKQEAIMIQAQQQAEKDMLDREAELQKEMIRAQVKQDETLMKAQVDMQAASTPDITVKEETPPSVVINNNIKTDKKVKKK